MRRRKKQQQFKRVKDCSFCKEGKDPDYKVPDKLLTQMSDRGKIIGRSRGGLCAKHQKKLSKAIKRARFLALIPFTQNI